jgi:two-component system, OmpR family, osmolarity sensor histidine kinase EnvZ
MNLPRIVPDTLLARTVVLIGLLLVASLAAWLALFTQYERGPRARQTAVRAVAMVNLTRAALLAAQPQRRQALLAELSRSEGIRIFPMAPEEAILPAPDTPFLRLVHAEIQRQLGPDTLLAGDEAGMANGDAALWVSFSLGPDDYWLVMPRTEARSGLPWQWLGWGVLTLLLSFGGGWFVVARINRPLRQTAQAAARIGQGQFDGRLPESGPAEIAALGKAFNRMGGDLAEMEQNRALMLAGIAHDLRTPLSRLRLAIEMSVPDESERAHMVRDLDDLDLLTRQFLDFARQDGQEDREAISLDDLAASLVTEYQQRGVAIQLQGQAGTAPAHAAALRRALTNLIENALRYGAQPVMVQLARGRDAVTLGVTDSGPGLAPEHLDKAKQPFFRGNAARTGAKGSGLGLAIVERIAAMHGGSLELSNRPGSGLTAEIRLPLQTRQKN